MTTKSEKPREMFKVLWPYDPIAIKRYEALGCPKEVPKIMVIAHEFQCMENHIQTVNRLNERGGLGPSELAAVLQDRRWWSLTIEDAVKIVLEHLAIWEAA